MTTFRKHFKKKQDCIRSGAGTEDIYQPCWFAYQFIESFLMPVYTCNYTLNTETSQQQHFDETDNEPGDREIDNDTSMLDDQTLNTPRPISTSTQTQSRRRPAPNLAEQQMAAAFGQLTNVLGRRYERLPPPEEDECDLYSKLLAKKLQELPKDERQVLMYQIDGLFINRLNIIEKHHHDNIPIHLIQMVIDLHLLNHLIQNLMKFFIDTIYPVILFRTLYKCDSSKAFVPH